MGVCFLLVEISGGTMTATAYTECSESHSLRVTGMKSRETLLSVGGAAERGGRDIFITKCTRGFDFLGLWNGSGEPKRRGLLLPSCRSCFRCCPSTASSRSFCFFSPSAVWTSTWQASRHAPRLNTQVEYPH
ncbi:hypothetical protein BJ170DRAFT_57973 [Xylariales sp. AK1849]|nr:hypothetical protein BJ170DRAFT_57973 [Xylariales sp. AK1849]